MSNNQPLVTIFGGSGFLGGYVVRRLAKSGVRIKIVSLNTEYGEKLKTAGCVGQICAVYGNIKDPESIKKAVQGSDIVINLVGILFSKRKGGFMTIHSQGAEYIAKAAKEAGARSLVHISALSVDKGSGSLYARSKRMGEEAVLAAFPEATILRPSIIFGQEDNFINLFARLACISPFLPLIGGGKTRFQPVYVDDVAKAILASITLESARGKIIQLGGPKIYSFREIIEFILKSIGKKRILVTWPFALARINAMFLEMFPNPVITPDQIKLLKVDNIVDDKAFKFKDLGIEPNSMEVVMPKFLARYR